MSLGVAVMAVPIAKFGSRATAVISWNATHFRSKLTITVLTPDEGLQQPPSTAGTTPPTGPIP
jgi:hypothetical protein